MYTQNGGTPANFKLIPQHHSNLLAQQLVATFNIMYECLYEAEHRVQSWALHMSQTKCAVAPASMKLLNGKYMKWASALRAKHQSQWHSQQIQTSQQRNAFKQSTTLRYLNIRWSAHNSGVTGGYGEQLDQHEDSVDSS